MIDHMRNHLRNRVLLRDFIHRNLYQPGIGYFSRDGNQFKHDRTRASVFNQIPIGTLSKPIEFNLLSNKMEFQQKLALEYQHSSIPLAPHSQWLTPAEIFQPYYAESIANRIVQVAKASDSSNTKPIFIVEPGAGTGILAKGILNYFKTHYYDSIFNRLHYMIYEISSPLCLIQMAQLREFVELKKCFISNKCIGKVTREDFITHLLHHFNGFKADENVISNYTDLLDHYHIHIVATELLDNLTHDCVLLNQDHQVLQMMVNYGMDLDLNDRRARISAQFDRISQKYRLNDTIVQAYSVNPLQQPKSAGLDRLSSVTDVTGTEVTGTEVTGTEMEDDRDGDGSDSELERSGDYEVDLEFDELDDALIMRTLSAYRFGDEGNGGMKEYVKLILDGIFAHRDLESSRVYVPTGAMKMLETLKHVFGKQHAITLADFDYLPETIPGRNAPLIQGQSKINCNIHSVQSFEFARMYKCDIMFPTNFNALCNAYETLHELPQFPKNDPNRHVQAVKSKEFLKHYSHSIDKTRTKSGYNPMLEEFSNTQFFMYPRINSTSNSNT